MITALGRLVLAMLVSAPGVAGAIGIAGSMTDDQGQGVYPCDVDITDRNTGLPVLVPGDTTLPDGSFNVALPNGRYEIHFNPPPGAHIFQHVERDVRVNNNTVSIVATLPHGRYLTGRVLGPDAAGVAGANIRFRDAAGNAPTNVQDDGAAADGTFLTLVDPGVWNVEVIPPIASHRAPVQMPGVDLSAADRALGVVGVPAGFIVTATATDAGFFPLFDASLQVRDGGGGAKRFAPLNNTDAGGVARIVVPAGSWDFTMIPPPGQAYATRTARVVTLGADVTLPNFALPAAVSLSAHCVTPALAPVAGVDVDVDSLPQPVRRLETPNDGTNAGGNVSVLVAPWSYRVTFSPPVASRLLPVRLDSVQVNAATNLGNVVLPQGHWVNASVVAEGSNAAVPGANLDFERVSTGQLLVTIGDVTNGAGFSQVVTDGDLYRLRVLPPGPAFDTLVVEGFRSLGDTAVTLVLPIRSAVGAPSAPAPASLQMSAPWPNPTRDGVSVTFATGRGSAALEAWDVNGRRVARLWDGEAVAPRTVHWDGRDERGAPVAAGVYWIRLAGDRGAGLIRRVAVMR